MPLSAMRKTHPGKWAVTLGALQLHLLSGLGQLLLSDSYFLAPSSEYVYAIPRWAWGLLQLALAVGLIYGLESNRTVHVRRCLAVGGGIYLMRAVLLVWALAAGKGGAIGIPGWVFVAVVHFAATVEPDDNPAVTSRQ